MHFTRTVCKIIVLMNMLMHQGINRD